MSLIPVVELAHFVFFLFNLVTILIVTPKDICHFFCSNHLKCPVYILSDQKKDLQFHPFGRNWISPKPTADWESIPQERVHSLFSQKPKWRLSLFHSIIFFLVYVSVDEKRGLYDIFSVHFLFYRLSDFKFGFSENLQIIQCVLIPSNMKEFHVSPFWDLIPQERVHFLPRQQPK